jgi:hypothetical protein
MPHVAVPDAYVALMFCMPLDIPFICKSDIGLS